MPSAQAGMVLEPISLWHASCGTATFTVSTTTLLLATSPTAMEWGAPPPSCPVRRRGPIMHNLATRAGSMHGQRRQGGCVRMQKGPLARPTAQSTQPWSPTPYARPSSVIR